MPGQLGVNSKEKHRASVGAKVITVFPGNDATPLDSHLGVVLLFEADMGRLLAIIDASSVTAIRTAAVSGVATKLLATPDAGDLAMNSVDPLDDVRGSAAYKREMVGVFVRRALEGAIARAKAGS